MAKKPTKAGKALVAATDKPSVRKNLGVEAKGPSDAKIIRGIVDRFAKKNPDTWELIRWKQTEHGIASLIEALGD